jgi:hypothetical protein
MRATRQTSPAQNPEWRPAAKMREPVCIIPGINCSIVFDLPRRGHGCG